MTTSKTGYDHCSCRNYAAKLERKKERYEELATKARKRADASFGRADLREEKSGIPLGQPILVGHHSEKRHRRALERADNAFRKGIEESNKAKHYENKANSVGKAGISSDDPEAVKKLLNKIEKIQKIKDLMVKVNKAYRKYKGDWNKIKEATDIPDSLAACAKSTLKVCPYEKQPFPAYELQNRGANIRRMKKRVNQLRVLENRTEEPPKVGDGYRIEQDKNANRVRFYFDVKPAKEVTQKMKQAGFRWSPTVGAWQRHLNNAGIYAAEKVAKELFSKEEG